MKALAHQKKTNKLLFIIAVIVMLSMAFFQCYKVTHDLTWAADSDFDRDIGFANGTLNGHYGQDPNYKDAWLWYNPLLFSVEAAISKTTSIPPNIVATRAGAYLNIFAPITFFVMAVSLFGFEIGLASLLSFLFLVSGNILGWGAATYSPWLYPVCFTQFLFYINILLCYKAFSRENFFWFALLGVSIGITFLGHTAPAVLIILIMLSLQLPRIFRSIKNRDYLSLKKYLLQGILAFVLFVIVAMPLLYYVLGKYHLHMINRMTFEYAEGIFLPKNFMGMIKENLSISLVVAVIGFVWFYKKFQLPLIRRIIFGWLFFTLGMYIYSTIVAVADSKFNIHLQGSTPSFHYFYYFKALQSVFFGFGFVFLLQQAFKLVPGNMKALKNSYTNYFFVGAVLVCAVAYFPFYRNRADFVLLRELAIAKQSQKDKIEVYHFILKNIPENKVILCDIDPSIFPVMATARKMVSIGFTFSNPYLDFDKRESDRISMLKFFRTGEPSDAKKLFNEYDVSIVLLENGKPDSRILSLPFTRTILFTNNSFAIYSLHN